MEDLGADRGSYVSLARFKLKEHHWLLTFVFCRFVDEPIATLRHSIIAGGETDTYAAILGA